MKREKKRLEEETKARLTITRRIYLIVARTAIEDLGREEKCGDTLAWGPPKYAWVTLLSTFNELPKRSSA